MSGKKSDKKGERSHACNLCQLTSLYTPPPLHLWRTRNGGVPDASPQPSPREGWKRDMRKSSGTKNKLPRDGL